MPRKKNSSAATVQAPVAVVEPPTVAAINSSFKAPVAVAGMMVMLDDGRIMWMESESVPLPPNVNVANQSTVQLPVQPPTVAITDTPPVTPPLPPIAAQPERAAVDPEEKPVRRGGGRSKKSDNSQTSNGHTPPQNNGSKKSDNSQTSDGHTPPQNNGSKKSDNSQTSDGHVPPQNNGSKKQNGRLKLWQKLADCFGVAMFTSKKGNTFPVAIIGQSVKGRKTMYTLAWITNEPKAEKGTGDRYYYAYIKPEQTKDWVVASDDSRLSDITLY